jgi:putative Ca2+/H+ antiporter (TMEM165/GDT1 family)
MIALQHQDPMLTGAAPTIDWPLFWSTFTVIALAEIPDKTAVATVVLATRLRAIPVFVGVAAAFVVQTVVAILAGSLLTLLPPIAVRCLAGGLFLVFALFMLLRPPEAEPPAGPVLAGGAGSPAPPPAASFWRTAGSAFLIIFIAEWGDLTQLATATMVGHSARPFTILVAAIAGLWAVTAVAVLIGNRARSFIRPQLMQRIAAIIFAVLGIAILSGAHLAGI